MRDQVKSTCGWLATRESIARADAILQSVLKNSIFSLTKEELEHVVVRMLTDVAKRSQQRSHAPVGCWPIA